MPIYEYRCEQGHTFEVMQRMTDDPVLSCQTCSAPVERVFHPVAVHFKGSGFYTTDYGSGKRSRESKEAGEGEGTAKGAQDEGSAKTAKDEAPAKSDAKTDAKPKASASSSSD